MFARPMDLPKHHQIWSSVFLVSPFQVPTLLKIKEVEARGVEPLFQKRLFQEVHGCLEPLILRYSGFWGY